MTPPKRKPTTRRQRPGLRRPLNEPRESDLDQTAEESDRQPCAADEQPPSAESQILYTPEEAAAKLRVRPSWLRRKASTRAIPCRFIGKHLRFADEDLRHIAGLSSQN
ncbi:helix-turn-helix domain-containing protein [Saccharopolyspora sp. NPDC049357]|uniref:helix-turn-helix domain-containing protein n=1 Tax=Saccharopolyspora sp. NPDC049357 TaxID=3154507 RepID=UPI00342802A5